MIVIFLIVTALIFLGGGTNVDIIEVASPTSLSYLIKQGKIGAVVGEIYGRIKWKRILSRTKQYPYIDFYPSEEEGWSGKRYEEHLSTSWKQLKQYLQQGKEVFIHVYCGIIREKNNNDFLMSDIKFQKKYEEKASCIISEQSTWVGVHIRRTDHKTSIKNSKTELFVSRMKEYIQSNEKIKFFLATDDENVCNELTGIFGDRIVTQMNIVRSRDCLSGMEAAIIDCLCLSKCNTILGSDTSVFSSFSAKYGNKELIICKQ